MDADIDTLLHRIGVGIAGVALGLGVVLLFVPSVAAAVPLAMWIGEVVALFGIGLGLWVARTRYRSDPGMTVVPAVEYRLATPSPGHELDVLVHRLTALREGTIEYRERIERRIADLAVDVIAHREDCSREEAVGKLEEGSWSDNVAATSFFGGGAPAGGSFSFVRQLLSRVSSTESPYESQLRETVSAIEALGEFDFAAGSSTDDLPGRGMDPDGILEEAAGERVTDRVRYLSTIPTRHWTGLTALAFLALGVGVVTAQPALLLASGVALGIAGYARLSRPPDLTDLEVARAVDEQTPEPGEEIRVSVAVENTGESFLPDLVLVERVPPTMQVVDGAARHGTALRPGETATFGYTAIVERGDHAWPLQVIGRDAAGATERVGLIETDLTVRCAPGLETTAEMPVRMQTSVYAGEVETDVGGEGLEFHSTRNYRPGDPKRRIDWKTYARSRSLTTVKFRKEHAARIVLLFDGRESSYVSTAPGRAHALDRAIEAAVDVYASLQAEGNLVGVAAFDGTPCWLAPNAGTLHRERVRRLFVDHPALSPLPPGTGTGDAGRYVDPMTHVRRQLPADTQIVLFTPLTDEYAYEVARRLDGAGHKVTVISPDPTTGRTVGQRIARLERSVLCRRLRDRGIRVVDRGEGTSLALELEYAKRRWQA